LAKERHRTKALREERDRWVQRLIYERTHDGRLSPGLFCNEVLPFERDRTRCHRCQRPTGHTGVHRDGTAAWRWSRSQPQLHGESP
jgi:hypothetical protein